MGVDAAKAEGADSSTAAAIAGLPDFTLFEQTEGAVGHIDSFGRCAMVGNGRENAVLHGQQGFHQRGSASGREQMPDIRFHRSDDALTRLPLLMLPQRLHTAKLNHVANRRTRSMAFDHVHIGRRPAGLGISRLHGALLTFGCRSQHATLTVIAQTNGVNHAINPVAITHGIIQAAQSKQATTFAYHKAIAIGIKRRRNAAGGKRLKLREPHLGVK